MSLTESLTELSGEPPFRLRTERRVLHFRTPARTSRGALCERTVYYVHAETAAGECLGTGECCTMPGLSPEEGADYESRLTAACHQTERQQGLRPTDFADTPSIRFGIEGALLRFYRPDAPLWDTPFARGQAGLRVHHLIWMDTAEGMLQQMQRGIENGFTCLKMKVGALPFAEEIAMLQEARRRYPHAELRVDANGAFPDTSTALHRMEQLAAAGVALIEQPLRAGQPKAMAELAAQSPLPLALDEELIAAATTDARATLLDTIRPHAIVIKPSLHGGVAGLEQWAALAAARGIRWWVNSALESHVGLTLLAELCGYLDPDTLHGLGTGKLFTDDFCPKLTQNAGFLHFSERKNERNAYL